MRIAIVAPRPVPYVHGGAENLWAGLHARLNERRGVECDLIKLAAPESSFWEIVDSYRAFARLDLDDYDRIITTKYPAWMACHVHHVVYLQHKLRGLYDTYPEGLATEIPDDAPIPRALLRLLAKRPTARGTLEDLTGLLDDLRCDGPGLPATLFALPGPLIRAVVHAFDTIGLSRGRIRRYFAISRTVAERADYFPRAVDIEIVHHPSNLSGLSSAAYDTIFTASRLDHPKRVALLVDAYRRSGLTLPFRIAGEGPELARLKAFAEDCPGIEFLGHLGDVLLADEYARALFVPFVPDREDYGLVTVEAMSAGKAVLTTLDAGGVTELVRHGENGLVVDPSPQALGRAMHKLVEEREVTIAMGERARASVEAITWERLLQALLSPRPRSRVFHARPRVVVANVFPSYPPLQGGQQRTYHLYRRLAEFADVVQVNLAVDAADAEAAGAGVQVRELAPGLVEVICPRGTSLWRQQREVEQDLGVSTGDLVAMEGFRSCPAWLDALREQTAQADAVVASHPYSFPAIRAVYSGPVVYEAHNVEWDLKKEIFERSSCVTAEAGGTDDVESGSVVSTATQEVATGIAARLLDRVRQVEGQCAVEAPLVLACSVQDAERLCALYNLDASRVCLIENGVDCESMHYIEPAARRDFKRRLQLEHSFVVLFLGSWHVPNLLAARRILEFARLRPDIEFAVLGSVGLHPIFGQAPANVHALGFVTEAEKRLWLSAADVGLNPMEAGSGTNLKLLDYAAVGLPIVSTPFGARGGALEAGRHYWPAEIPDTLEALDALRALPVEAIAARVRAARAQVEAVADWRVLAARYWERLRRLSQ